MGGMLSMTKRLIIFSDLDGCLLNKHDYDWAPAASTLDRLRQQQVPVILNSSKTVAEMQQWVDELGLVGNSFISENGSVIYWGEFHRQDPSAGEIQVIGAAREFILATLDELKSSFRFRSFAELGVAGVIRETQLSPQRAQQALQRQGTEPLVWDDSAERLLDFQSEIEARQLTLTKGGRFWHVAGRTNKGKAMQIVAQRLSEANTNAMLPAERTIIVAIGDSPIDQSMLDMADVPIGIPTATGLGVRISPVRGIVPVQPGAAGWAEAVNQLLNRTDLTASGSPPLV